MALVYDLKTDVRFKQGREKEKEQLIKNLVQKGLLTHEQIAEVAEASIEHIQDIAQRLTNS